jgi:hypothetical protein
MPKKAPQVNQKTPDESALFNYREPVRADDRYAICKRCHCAGATVERRDTYALRGALSRRDRSE